MKKILVLGGTGAMGLYLVPELVKKGYQVDVVALDAPESNCENLRYIKADAHDVVFLKKMLSQNYDAVIDFLYHNSAEYDKKYALFLENTNQYIYLSSYRVYAGGTEPLNEQSKRLTDIPEILANEAFMKTDDYALMKIRTEDILLNSKYKNYTILRPAITFSKNKFQLMSLEADYVLRRAFQQKAIVLPREAMGKQCCMTWAGDVAKILSRLFFNDKAMGEVFIVGTAEHHPWSYIADCYKEAVGLEVVESSREEFFRIISNTPDEYNAAKWRLDYDRMYDRMVDNSKILAATGLTQSDLTPVWDALTMELMDLSEKLHKEGFSATSLAAKWPVFSPESDRKMDEFILKSGQVVS